MNSLGSRPNDTEVCQPSTHSLNIRGLTLVELLVVIAIISVLVGLLLPSVQSAREAARRATCGNRQWQIALGLQNHHSAVGTFPFGGWGHEWVGVSGRGSKANQPGGWAFSLLPYLEQKELHGLATVDLDEPSYTRMLETPLVTFNCPSRRAAVGSPAVAPHVKAPRPAGAPRVVGRGDYAINAGASHIFSLDGPPSLEIGSMPSYWRSRTEVYDDQFTGVCHLRYGARVTTIIDGVSNTYMIGEKYLAPEHYSSGISPGDNETLYSGYCTDLHRYAGNLGSEDPLLAPWPDNGQDETAIPGFLRFGSAHPQTFGMAYCDGSVRWISYNIDPLAHLRAGHRADEGAPLAALP